nr:prepilin peptidase [uncultured Sphingomonas sp.]
MGVALVTIGGLLGAIIGSFLATLCLRWPDERSVVTGRSCCDGCGKPIPARHLVPLVSGLAAGGKAWCCGARIDPLHLRVEWAAALIAGMAIAIEPSWRGAALAGLGFLLLPLFVLDSRHFWLPDRLVLLLALAGLPLGGLVSQDALSSRAVTALVAGAGLAVLAILYRRIRGRDGLGGGDPKLLAALALWLGPQLTVATLLGAALLGLAEALWKRRQASEAQPFGAYLCFAAWIVAALAMVRW